MIWVFLTERMESGVDMSGEEQQRQPAEYKI